MKNNGSANGKERSGVRVGRGTVFEALKRDHQQIVQLFDALEATSEDAVRQRTETFKRLRGELDAHSRAEEITVYSTLMKYTPTRERIENSIEAHHVVTLLLGELDAMPKSHPRWASKLKVLRENFEHHVDDEEQHLFADAQEVISTEETRRLANDFRMQKRAWVEIDRRAPAIANLIRGAVQTAERLPIGSGAIAAMVQMSPHALQRAASRLRSSKPRDWLGGGVRAMTWPITMPLRRVLSR